MREITTNHEAYKLLVIKFHEIYTLSKTVLQDLASSDNILAFYYRKI